VEQEIDKRKQKLLSCLDNSALIHAAGCATIFHEKMTGTHAEHSHIDVIRLGGNVLVSLARSPGQTSGSCLPAAAVAPLA
jgi:hypothetical protein